VKSMCNVAGRMQKWQVFVKRYWGNFHLVCSMHGCWSSLLWQPCTVSPAHSSHHTVCL